MMFWSVSQYIHPQMRMEMTFWPCYGRRIFSLHVRWSAGTTLSISIIHKSSACTSLRGFIYLCMYVVRIIYKPFWFFLCVPLYANLVSEQNPHLSFFFPRNLLSFFHTYQGPRWLDCEREQKHHPDLQPVSHRGCLLMAEGGGDAGSPSSPSYHGIGDNLQASSYSVKKMLGANTFFRRNLAWLSPSLLACSSTHLPTKRLINVYFFPCFHMVCSQAFACVCMNAHLHWLLWGNCSTNAGHLQINAST